MTSENELKSLFNMDKFLSEMIGTSASEGDCKTAHDVSVVKYATLPFVLDVFHDGFKSDSSKDDIFPQINKWFDKPVLVQTNTVEDVDKIFTFVRMQIREFLNINIDEYSFLIAQYAFVIADGKLNEDTRDTIVSVINKYYKCNVLESKCTNSDIERYLKLSVPEVNRELYLSAVEQYKKRLNPVTHLQLLFICKDILNIQPSKSSYTAQLRTPLLDLITQINAMMEKTYTRDELIKLVAVPYHNSTDNIDEINKFINTENPSYITSTIVRNSINNWFIKPIITKVSRREDYLLALKVIQYECNRLATFSQSMANLQ